MSMSEQCDLRTVSRSFIAEAFDALRAENVIPTAVFHPYIALGRDYFGDSIRALSAYPTLEAQLDEAYPERFADPLKRHHSEFASTYMFSLIEACVVRCAQAGSFDSESTAVDESIDEMLRVLGMTSYEMVCIRHVSHLTTTSGGELHIGDVTVVPEPEEWGGLLDRVQHEIGGAAQA
jgi:hypothetical protein